MLYKYMNEENKTSKELHMTGYYYRVSPVNTVPSTITI